MDLTDTRTGRHPVNIGHLVMGLAFAGILGVWALIEVDMVPDDNIRWLLPVPWVIAGAAGLLAVALAGARRSRRTPEAQDAPEPEDTTTTEEIR